MSDLLKRKCGCCERDFHEPAWIPPKHRGKCPRCYNGRCHGMHALTDENAAAIRQRFEPGAAHPEWWHRFAAEMVAIGAIVKGTDLITGEIDIDVPDDKIEEAKAIMQRYWDPASLPKKP